MLQIGLTGGIGSGKSTIAKIFEVLEIPVYYADDAAKRIMNEDEDLKKEIIRHFGPESYKEGKLNRAYISSKVFDNQEKLATLNRLVHPATIQDSERWMLQQKAPYAIKEAALIFESGLRQHLDYVIGVSSPMHMRIQRILQRDNITAEQAESRMKSQMDEAKKMALCDFVISNDETKALLPQVLALHQQLLELNRTKKH